MAKKKKRSKFKKILKSLGKVAALGGAAYGASKLFGGRRGSVSTAGQPVGISRVADMPAHLGETVHQKWGTGVPDRVKMLPTDTMGGPSDKKWYKPSTWFSAKGGRAGAAKGGRVGVGIAKRGFGRALMKGKK